MKREEKKVLWAQLTGKDSPRYAEEKAIEGQGELVAADGGALVDREIRPILSPNFALGSIYSQCKIMNLAQNNGIKLPRYDTSSADDTAFWGVEADWVVEGETMPESKILFDQKVNVLKKLAVTIPFTDEIADDVEFLPSYVDKVGGEALTYKIDEAIIYGDAATAMGGVVGSNDEATVYVVKGVTWAATAALMIGSYYGGKDGMWVVSNKVYGEIVIEFANDFGLQWLPDGTALLYGYPIHVMPAANAETMLLGDFSQYLVVQKEIRKEVSEHFYFNSYQGVARMVARLQGCPIWSSTMTLEDATIVAPFVAISTMDGEG